MQVPTDLFHVAAMLTSQRIKCSVFPCLTLFSTFLLQDLAGEIFSFYTRWQCMKKAHRGSGSTQHGKILQHIWHFQLLTTGFATWRLNRKRTTDPLIFYMNRLLQCCSSTKSQVYTLAQPTKAQICHCHRHCRCHHLIYALFHFTLLHTLFHRKNTSPTRK